MHVNHEHPLLPRSMLSTAHRCLQLTLVSGSGAWLVLRPYLPADRVADLSLVELLLVIAALGLPGAVSLVDVYRRAPRRRREAGSCCLATAFVLLAVALGFGLSLAFLSAAAACLILLGGVWAPRALARLA